MVYYTTDSYCANTLQENYVDLWRLLIVELVLFHIYSTIFVCYILAAYIYCEGHKVPVVEVVDQPQIIQAIPVVQAIQVEGAQQV